VGMTGSGKTALGIVLIEELLQRGIPVLAVDPKGDLGNLLLNFPGLAPEEFAPFVDPSAGTPESEAKKWADGLAGWGLGPSDVKALLASRDAVVYTPGSTAGIPLHLFGACTHPPAGGGFAHLIPGDIFFGYDKARKLHDVFRRRGRCRQVAGEDSDTKRVQADDRPGCAGTGFNWDCNFVFVPWIQKRGWFGVVVLAKGGKRVAADGLNWGLNRLDTNWQWYRRDGQWNYEAVTLTRKIADGTFNATADGALPKIEPTELCACTPPAKHRPSATVSALRFKPLLKY